MSAIHQREGISVLSKLEEQLQISRAHKQEQETANKLKESLEKQLNQHISNLEQILILIDENKNILKVCKNYLAKKKMKALTTIKKGIEISNSIIPDADIFTLEIKEKEARIVNSEGISVYDAEGAAYASLVSLYTRFAIIENTQVQKFVLLDEVLSNLSPESSAALSMAIQEKSKTMQIILIEQKPEIFSHGVDTSYVVTKDGTKSEVIKCISQK